MLNAFQDASLDTVSIKILSSTVAKLQQVKKDDIVHNVPKSEATLLINYKKAELYTVEQLPEDQSADGSIPDSKDSKNKKQKSK